MFSKEQQNFMINLVSFIIKLLLKAKVNIDHDIYLCCFKESVASMNSGFWFNNFSLIRLCLVIFLTCWFVLRFSNSFELKFKFSRNELRLLGAIFNWLDYKQQQKNRYLNSKKYIIIIIIILELFFGNFFLELI